LGPGQGGPRCGRHRAALALRPSRCSALHALEQRRLDVQELTHGRPAPAPALRLSPPQVAAKVDEIQSAVLLDALALGAARCPAVHQPEYLAECSHRVRILGGELQVRGGRAGGRRCCWARAGAPFSSGVLLPLALRRSAAPRPPQPQPQPQPHPQPQAPPPPAVQPHHPAGGHRRRAAAAAAGRRRQGPRLPGQLQPHRGQPVPRRGGGGVLGGGAGRLVQVGRGLRAAGCGLQAALPCCSSG
jgi:hypothetical protein